MKRLLIDSDLQVDDALALTAGFMEEDFEIVAITTSNYDIDNKATLHALNLMDILDWDIPIYEGESETMSKPIDKNLKLNTALEDYNFPPAQREIESIPAYEAIYRLAQEDGNLDLLLLGPLTNLAKALDEYPDLPEYLGDVFIMGGAINGGNITSTAEFNFYVDPEAVKKVLSSDLNIFINGLDTTQMAGLNPEDISLFENSNSPARDLILYLLNYLKDNKLDEENNIFYLHDLVALYAYSIKEAIIYEEINVNIRTEGEKRGQLYVPDLNEAEGFNVFYGTRLNPENFKKYVIDRLNA